MERERLRVETFACLREVDLEVGGINILIGPQATGKSVLAKLLYFFQGFPDAMLHSLLMNHSFGNFCSTQLSIFEKYFPLRFLQDRPFKIRHELSANAWIEVSRGSKKNNPVQILFSPILRKIFNKMDGISTEYKNEKLKVSSSPFPALLSDIHSFRLFHQDFRVTLKQMDIPYLNRMFIPAGRTFFSQPETLSYRFMKEGVSMDPFLVEFGSQYGDLKTRFIDASDSGKLASILPLIENVLRGNYVRKNEKDYLALSDGRRVDLLFASSGQQEFLPLAITLADSLFIKFSTYTGSVKYIEEPEAHLFPTSQHEIVKLMATVFNNAVQPLRLVITTHSPYILTAFNNLIQAGETREKLDKSRHPELFRIVPEDQILAPDAVCAYEVDHGTATAIRSEETGNLILAERLDGVSTEILSAFDKLLDLE